MAISKYEYNPILTKENVPFPVNSIFNAGAVKFNDIYLLLCRVELPTGKSVFVIAESDNGIKFTVRNELCLTPEKHNEFYEYAEWGIEDPRITQIENKFYILYTGYSKHMPVVLLAETENFKEFTIHGPISEPSNKNAVLFPEKINASYWKLDRPSTDECKDIWINKSPDIIHWGNYKFLAGVIPGTWESYKIGACTQPIKTKDGWLLLYHGVRKFDISTIYRIGILLLDLQNPWVIKGRSNEPILSPEFDYERVGDVSNVIFCNGWIVEPNGEVKIYYSGADTNICLAETTVEYLLSRCKSI